MDEQFYRPMSSQNMTKRSWKKLKMGTLAVRVILFLMSLSLLIGGTYFVSDRWSESGADTEDGKLAAGVILLLAGFVWTSYNLLQFTRPGLYVMQQPTPSISNFRDVW